MSAVHTELASAGSNRSRPQHPRAALPVGSRFPRRVNADGSDVPSQRSPGGAPILPPGVRFPRRTAADIINFLAERELGHEPNSSARRIYPVGARFPLR